MDRPDQPAFQVEAAAPSRLVSILRTDPFMMVASKYFLASERNKSY